jgi:hypothetical protein
MHEKRYSSYLLKGNAVMNGPELPADEYPCGQKNESSGEYY